MCKFRFNECLRILFLKIKKGQGWKQKESTEAVKDKWRKEEKLRSEKERERDNLAFRQIV